MAAVLDAPMASDPFVPALGRRAGRRGHPIDGLGGLLQETGRGTASADCALQSRHGLDERLPRRMAEPRLRRKDGQLARLSAIAAFRPARRRAARLAACRAELEQATQALLIVLHLRQQVIAGRDHAFEQFYGMARPSSGVVGSPEAQTGGVGHADDNFRFGYRYRQERLQPRGPGRFRKSGAAARGQAAAAVSRAVGFASGPLGRVAPISGQSLKSSGGAPSWPAPLGPLKCISPRSASRLGTCP